MEEQIKKNAAGYSASASVNVSNEVATAFINMLGIVVGKLIVLADRSEKRADERHNMQMAREQLDLDNARKRAEA